ncbi:hypothetical protein GSI_12387 [Ganoderma sinense ZZ0214-1]|uniref:Uncharacterized protein n=1 Tax=Ganoderma sinense ZZ0214-1 TaxID=1077348 RepID=A0A2G8RVL7_9APHY|nr:hypothetical protein GSI_12387 [Ganoderma sinense ZZ0214-1]
MSSDNWRTSLHTFADENREVYTITNVPPIINIAPIDEAEVHTNFNVGALLRPRINPNSFPELPFVLSRDPVGDPLLSRLCLDPAGIVPTRFERGWALADNIRQAWIRLESGLLHVSEILLTSTERSPCGTYGRYAIRDQAHWPPPQDYGYREIHQSACAAQRSIIRSHVAFRLLVARCSLAVALWLFPGADDDGMVRAVVTTRYDAEVETVVPDWVTFLKRQGVPHSWIDALRDSLLTDFSINLRVGTVIDPPHCECLAILPVLRAAHVPIFVQWRNRSLIAQFGAALPFMKVFAPRSPQEVDLARQYPPAGKPRIVFLSRCGEIRRLPDYSAFDDKTPPFGPYQLPHESREKFFMRRERYSSDQARQQATPQSEWRRQRQALANAGMPPFRQSRVYLWVYAQVLYPDLPPHWLDYEYRFPIPPAAYRSLWMTHPPSCRKYHSYYDEWDLWFPLGWGQQRGDAADLEPGLLPSTQGPRASLTVSAKSIWEHNIASTVGEEQELLIATPEDRDIRTIVLPYNLRIWYGLRIADTRTYDNVDYQKFSQRQALLFAQNPYQFPDDQAILKSIAGWTWAMMEGQLQSPALQYTWDLHKDHPEYLLRKGVADPHNSIVMDQHRAPMRLMEHDDIGRWVQVMYEKDPCTQKWSIFTSALGALMLVRCIDRVQTSLDAILILVLAGIPARTGIPLDSPPSPAVTMTAPPFRPLRLPYRQRGERPSLKDYDAYCQRVLELSRRPHVRAAWLKGGIVWRIMMEVTGGFAGDDGDMTFQDQVTQGPSDAVDHHEPVTMEREGKSFYDDDLSLAELDIISGVVRVYTGVGAQTEDVSWWPKHHAWVNGSSYTGIWTEMDEYWFNKRLRKIYEDEAQPLNSHEWREALRKNKGTGRLMMAVDEQSWRFTYRNFIQKTNVEDLDEIYSDV